MSESFDDMMRREFGDDFGEVPEMDGELLELYKRHGLPPEAAILVHQQVKEGDHHSPKGASLYTDPFGHNQRMEEGGQ